MYDLQKGYELAKELYAQYGVDVDKAMELCDSTPISIHCWQGDDVTGFEKNEGELTGELRRGEFSQEDIALMASLSKAQFDAQARRS